MLSKHRLEDRVDPGSLSKILARGKQKPRIIISSILSSLLLLLSLRERLTRAFLFSWRHATLPLSPSRLQAELARFQAVFIRHVICAIVQVISIACTQVRKGNCFVTQVFSFHLAREISLYIGRFANIAQIYYLAHLPLFVL